MPRVDRTADVTWEGNVARGRGTISARTGAFTGLPYSVPTRVGPPDGKTSPEELVAAAHAGCFAMSLATELSSAGTPPERLDVRATVTLDEVEGVGHRIVASEIEARVRASGLEPDALEALAEAADRGCTLSALIKASAAVSINARLEGGNDGN